MIASAGSISLIGVLVILGIICAVIFIVRR